MVSDAHRWRTAGRKRGEDRDWGMNREDVDKRKDTTAGRRSVTKTKTKTGFGQHVAIAKCETEYRPMEVYEQATTYLALQELCSSFLGGDFLGSSFFGSIFLCF